MPKALPTPVLTRVGSASQRGGLGATPKRKHQEGLRPSLPTLVSRTSGKGASLHAPTIQLPNTQLQKQKHTYGKGFFTQKITKRTYAEGHGGGKAAPVHSFLLLRAAGYPLGVARSNRKHT